MSSKPCGKCGKGVYPLEMIVACDKSWHKQCFRCTHCDLVISLKGFATIDGNPYCKPHYLELFKTKGSYKVFSDQEGNSSSSYNASQGFKGYGAAEPSKPKPSTPSTEKKGRVGFTEPAKTPDSPVANQQPNRDDLMKQVEKEDQHLKPASSVNDRSAPVIEPVSIKQVDRKAILKEGIVEHPPTLRNADDFVNDRSSPVIDEVDSSKILKPPPQKSILQEIRGSESPKSATSSPKAAAASSPSSSSPKTGGATNKCHKCAKTVYDLEMIRACDKVYHKQCFRCKHCDGVLSLKGFAVIENEPYCKPHYLEIFKTKGNYNVFTNPEAGSSGYNASLGFKGY